MQIAYKCVLNTINKVSNQNDEISQMIDDIDIKRTELESYKRNY